MKEGRHKRYAMLTTRALVWVLQLNTPLIKKGGHKRYETPSTVAVVWHPGLSDVLFIWAVFMSSQWVKQLLSADWSHIALLNFVKFSNLLIEKGSHKRNGMLTTLAVAWAFWFFRISFCPDVCWWALKEQHSCCLLIDQILNSSTLLSWALCWWRRVPTSHM